MEGSVYIPFVVAARVNVPPASAPGFAVVTLYIESTTGQLMAKKSDNTVLAAAAGAVAVLFT